MPVLYDTVVSGRAEGVSAFTPGAITIADNPDRAVALGIAFYGIGGAGATLIMADVGGVPAYLVEGTDSEAADPTLRSMIFVCVAPPTGSQVVNLSWSTLTLDIILGVVSVSGCRQLIPMGGGTFLRSPAGVAGPSVAIESLEGDLTLANVASADVLAGSNQTQRWADAFNRAGTGSTGPGTAGPITHSWTTVVAFAISGANFVAAEVGLPGTPVPQRSSRQNALERRAP